MKFMRIFLCLIHILPLASLAQYESDKGIKWTSGLSLEQIKQKAKAENKFIFIDCYATWCGPCKLMDMNVYPNDKVGDFFNNNFISIKVQMDSTNRDNNDIQNWYAEASRLRKSFNIHSLPTFIFLAPNGSIVHRGQAFMKETDFIDLGSKAINPNTQYYTQLAEYLHGTKKYSTLSWLATMAKEIDDKDMSKLISEDYIANYLYKLEDNELYSKENIKFIASFTESSNDKGFQIFYQNFDRINKSIDKVEYAENVIRRIITNEEIKPALDALEKNNEPNWSKIEKNIKRKYNAGYASQTVVAAKMTWYWGKKQWPETFDNAIKLISSYKQVSDMFLNNVAWEIFLHSKDKKQINAAIKWMEELVARDTISANRLDTYANLLYKSGRISEAIAIEQNACNKSPKSKSFQTALEKMKRGEPTWVSIEDK